MFVSPSQQEHFDVKSRLIKAYKTSLAPEYAEKAIKAMKDNPLIQKHSTHQNDDYVPYYNQRPYGNWRNYVIPDYNDYFYYPPSSYSTYGDYPFDGMMSNETFGYLSPYGRNYGFNRGYNYGGNRRWDRYDYTNIYPTGERCFAKIGVNDAFGPYAQVMGKQAWIDWAGRNGFDKVWVQRQSKTNDHAIVPYIGECPYAAQKPPNPKQYQIFNSTSNWY